MNPGPHNAEVDRATKVESSVEQKINHLLMQEQARLGLQKYNFVYLNAASRPLEIHYLVTNVAFPDGLPSVASVLQLIATNNLVTSPLGQSASTEDHGDQYCVQLCKGGENGFVSILTACSMADRPNEIDASSDRIHSMNNLLSAIHCEIQMHQASVPSEKALSAREREVLIWSGNGKTSWEISRIMNKSEATINFHLRNAMAKLNCVNRCQAVAKSIALGVIGYQDIVAAHQQEVSKTSQ